MRLPRSGFVQTVLMTNLFVGNLASNRTPDELRTLFQTYGSVEGVEVMTDPQTRYSRGFAVVGMTNDLEAKKAIANLNGAVLWESRFEWKSLDR